MPSQGLDQNIINGNKHRNSGDKCLKTSFFRRKPNYDQAIHEYKQAISLYTLSKENGGRAFLIETLYKLADIYYKSESAYSAAKTLENCAQEINNARKLKQQNRAIECSSLNESEILAQAANYYRENQQPDKSVQCLMKAARQNLANQSEIKQDNSKTNEHNDVDFKELKNGITSQDSNTANWEKTKEYFDYAMEIIDCDERGQFNNDVFTNIASIACNKNDFKYTCSVLKRQAEMQAKLSNIFSKTIRATYLSIIIVLLVENRIKEAEIEFDQQITNAIDYSSSDEGQFSKKYLDAYKSGNNDSLKELCKNSLLAIYLPNQILKASRKIHLPVDSNSIEEVNNEEYSNDSFKEDNDDVNDLT